MSKSLCRSLLRRIAPVSILFVATLTSPLLYAEHSLSALWFDVDDVQLPQNATVGLLNNGMRYVVLPTSRKENFMSIRIRIGAGTAQENELSAFSSRLLALNTIENTDWLAATFMNQTVFSFDGNALDASEMSELLSNFRYRLNNAHQLPNTANITAFDSKTSSQFSDFSAAQDYRNTQSSVSWQQGIETLSKPILDSYHSSLYVPKNTTIIITGNVNPHKVISIVDKTFNPTQTYSELPIISSVQKQYPAPHSTQDTIVLSSRTTIPFPSDSKKLRRDLLLNDISTRIVSNRVQNKLQQSFEHAKARNATFYMGNAIMTSLIVEGVPPIERNEAKSMVEIELNRAVSSGFTAAEYEDAVSELRDVLSQQARKPAKLYAMAEADNLVKSINTGLVYMTPSDKLALLDFHVAHLNELDVNKEFTQLWATKSMTTYNHNRSHNRG